MEIKKNEITAIVGRSGEGKTTILSLINKFYKVEDNIIFIKNHEVKCTGTHDDLMTKCKDYNNLYKIENNNTIS